MKTSVLILSSLVILSFLRAEAPAVAGGSTGTPGPQLRVAAVQLRSLPDLAANVAKIKAILAECAAQRVQIAAFPECAVSSYDAAAIKRLTGAAIAAAEREIAAACREHGIAAVVGTPELRDGKLYNTALIITAQGEIVGRYDKTHLVGQDEAWQCTPGSGLPPVFSVGSTRATVIICHDSRYPELSRLPVLAGARVIFYISSEAVLLKENKMGPYRAQVQARAVENGVYVVHPNPPADSLNTGSHGQSRIVAPDGNVLQEASQLQPEVLIASLDLSEATAKNGLRSMEEGPLADWWRAAVQRVPVLP